MVDRVKKSFIDPESGEEDIVSIPTSINGWEYEPEKRGAAVAWVNPDDESVYIGWEKTGGHTYSAWISVPGEIPRDTVYDSFGSPEEALDRAEDLMRKYTPQEATEKEW